MKHIKFVRTYPGADINSDHKPIFIKYKTQAVRINNNSNSSDKEH